MKSATKAKEMTKNDRHRQRRLETKTKVMYKRLVHLVIRNAELKAELKAQLKRQSNKQLD